MSINLKIFSASMLSALILASCSSDKIGLNNYSQAMALNGTNGTYKVGTPYKISGKWYYPEEDYSYSETGIASWYGKDFHAKYTANGEVYDMNALTAAHRTLPLPSIVRVTNMENGRSLVLRVNDRGPFAKDRIIDISKRGAQLLGFQAQGTARVKVEILPEESRNLKAALQNGSSSIRLATSANSARSALTNAGSGRLFIQAGSFSHREMANNLSSNLNQFGQTSVVPADVNGSRYYRVRVGPFNSRSEANSALSGIHGSGLTEAVIVE